jgi:hypothetical protein
MDPINIEKIIDEIMQNIPTKDVFEKCLLDLIVERNNLLSNEEENKKLIEEVDKVIESIQIYLSIASR